MADTPTPKSDEGSGSDAPFLKMLAKVGIQLEPINDQELKKAFTPLQKYMTEFSKTTDIKNTFFGKLPGIKQMLGNMKPDLAKFTDQLAALGYASKHDANNNTEFYDSLGILGKTLANTIGWLKGTETEFYEVNAAMDVASFGLTALITLFALIAQGIWSTIDAGIKWQDRLNEFSKTMGGIGKDRILSFNDSINSNIKSLQGYGFALGDIVGSIDSYIKSGLSPAIATNHNLTKATMQLSTVTGESASELANFFSGIYRGSRLSLGEFQKMGDAFTTFNASAEKSGKIGVISFSDFKEAITSVGTALLIAASKGDKFTEHMTADLMGLTSLAKTLNVSVSAMNGMFEQAGNLITSQESGFRAILAISGGAGIKEMIGNQFDRTAAMLKVSDKLEQLTKQFGGNLNIMGQVAEQAFQIPKDMAIKFATMTAAQKQAIRQARDDAEFMKTNGLDKAWTNVSTTIHSVFDRFRNTLFTMFQTAFVGNTGLQHLLNSIGDNLGRYLKEISQPGSALNNLVGRLGSFLERMFTGVDSFIPKIVPWIDTLVSWIEKLMNYIAGVLGKMQDHGFWGGLWEGIKGFVLVPLLKIFEAGAVMISDAIIFALRDVLSGWLSDGNTNSLSEIIKADLGKIFNPDELSKESSPIIKALNKNTEMQAIANHLSEIEKQKSEISGFKDTDLMLGRDGQFTLAGMERNKLDAAQEALEAQQKMADNSDKHTALLTDISDTLHSYRLNQSDVGIANRKVLPARTPITDVQLGNMARGGI